MYLRHHTFIKQNLVRTALGLIIITLSCSCSSLKKLPQNEGLNSPINEPKVTALPKTNEMALEASVYRNPTIAVVELRSHIDEQGRLLGPQLMYQVIDPGGWNLDQVDKQGGRLRDSLRPSYKNPQIATDLEPILPENILKEVIFTGIMQYSEKSLADAIRLSHNATFGLLYDTKAGWLLIPPR